jgi:hypothetical protein
MTIPKILESYNPQEDIWDELMGEDGVRPIYECRLPQIKTA